MLNCKFIILGFMLISKLFSEEIMALSSSFVIDTVAPQLELFSPTEGSEYEHGSTVPVTWIGTDDSPAPFPIVINASAYLDNPYFELANQIPNNGHYDLPSPSFINSSFVSVRVDMIDYYGNITYAYNAGYFTIGSPENNDIVTITFYEEFTSTTMVMDTKKPTVDLLSPNDQMIYEPGQSVSISWEAVDENLLEDSGISLHLLADNGLSEYLLIENTANSSPLAVTIPNIETQFGQFKVSAKDYFGNMSNDLSDEYIIIGTEDESDFEVIASIDSSYTSSITIDTKPPEFLHLNEGGNYFYPHGGEIVTDYSECPINWDCHDDSFENGTVTVSLAYLLGGWYLDIGTYHHDDFYLQPVDLSLDGLVDETLWARLLFTATDDYGNQYSKYNDDYFVLGDSEGDLDINWVDEEEDEIMINWAWEAKHSIMIRRSAINQYLQPGDIITLVDNLGIPSSSCDDEYGYTELKQIIINDNNTIGGPKSILKGIDHCAQQGQRRPGFIEGNPIIFKITKITDASSYFVYPNAESTVGNTSYTSGGQTVVRSIDFANPISLDNYNPNYIINNDRDFDSFNVYYKVNAANLRDCNPVPVSGYNDSNGDGVSDANWCYDTTVYGETDYLTNVPGMTQSSRLTYRVWLMDNAQQEVFRTVDTSMDINIELSDIYDKSLNSGWNWFSLNMTNADMGINNILSSLESTLVEGDYIKSQGGYADFYSGFGWFGTLENFDNTNMYKLDVDNPGNITFEGAAVDVLSNPIELTAGWNWVSYLPQEEMDINSALASLTSTGADLDYIKSQGGYADYYAGFGWFGTLENLAPRAGYMLDVENNSTLLYPESGMLSSIDSEIPFNRYLDEFNYQDYENNGSVTIALDLYDLTPNINDEIRAFYNDEIRGVAKAIICPINDNIVFPMMMYSNSSDEEFTFKYYSNNEEVELIETITFIPDMHLNNAIDPYIMTDEHPLTYSLSNAYPNPFNPSTTIGYSIADDMNNLQINVYDIQGRLIEQLYAGAQSKGAYQIIWNASNVSSGLYFVNMIANNHQFTKKIILVK